MYIQYLHVAGRTGRAVSRRSTLLQNAITMTISLLSDGPPHHNHHSGKYIMHSVICQSVGSVIVHSKKGLLSLMLK